MFLFLLYVNQQQCTKKARLNQTHLDELRFMLVLKKRHFRFIPRSYALPIGAMFDDDKQGEWYDDDQRQPILCH